MRSLAVSLGDGVLADAILIPPCPLVSPTNIRRVRGSDKVCKLKNKEEMLEWLIASQK